MDTPCDDCGQPIGWWWHWVCDDCGYKLCDPCWIERLTFGELRDCQQSDPDDPDYDPAAPAHDAGPLAPAKVRR